MSRGGATADGSMHHRLTLGDGLSRARRAALRVIVASGAPHCAIWGIAENQATARGHAARRQTVYHDAAHPSALVPLLDTSAS